MKIYYAHSNSRQDYYFLKNYNVLFTYVYYQNKLDIIKKTYRGKFVDSSALQKFQLKLKKHKLGEEAGAGVNNSALNKEISLDSYIDFIFKVKSYVDIYANFDTIGDAEETYKNQYIMEKLGLEPLPVYHVGEDKLFLKLYCKNYFYVGLGGLLSIGLKKEKNF